MKQTTPATKKELDQDFLPEAYPLVLYNPEKNSKYNLLN